MKDKNITLLRFVNLTAYAAMVVVNYLAARLPINGITPGEVSDSYPNLFAPAGLTFSIWGLIYLLLAGFILYQFGVFKGKCGYSTESVMRIGWMFALSSLANIGWIFSWHYQIIPLSMAFIAAMLMSLILTYTRINSTELTKKERFFIRLPFSIYFGWITIATIANVTVLLVSLGVDGFGASAPVWMIITLAAGVAIGIATTLRNKDSAYGLVLVWAYLGILLKHLNTFGGQYTQVIIAVIVSLVILLGAAIYAARRPKSCVKCA